MKKARIRKLQLNRTNLFAKNYKEETESPCTPKVLYRKKKGRRNEKDKTKLRFQKPFCRKLFALMRVGINTE